MKNVVYLAPIFLLSLLGKGAMADQVEHISRLDGAFSQIEQDAKLASDAGNTPQEASNKQVANFAVNNIKAANLTTSFATEKTESNAPAPIIVSPQNGTVHVHYIDANGNAVDNSSHDYDIDVAKTGQGSYNVPNGYSLNNPDGKYTISGGAFNGTNLKGNVDHYQAQYKPDYNGLTTGNKYADIVLKNRNMLKPGYGVSVSMPWSQGLRIDFDDGDLSHVVWEYDSNDYILPRDHSDDDNIILSCRISPNGYGFTENTFKDHDALLNFADNAGDIVDTAKMFRVKGEIKQTEVSPAYDVQHLPVAFVDSNNNIVGMVQNYSGKVGTTQNVSLTVPTGYKLADGASLPTSVTFQNSTDPLLVKVVPSGKKQRITNNTINVKFVDQESGQQVGTDVISLTKAHDGPNYYNTPAGYGADVNSYHVDKGVRYETGIYLVQLGKTVYPDSPNGYDSRLANAIFSNLPGGDFNLEYYHDCLTVGYHGRKLDLSTDDVHYWHNLMISVGKGGNDQGIDTEIRDGDVDTGKRSFTDNLHTISGNTVTVPVHKSTTYQFADSSGNAVSANGNTVNVVLRHQIKTIDANSSSFNTNASSNLFVINGSSDAKTLLKSQTRNFKASSLLDLVTNTAQMQGNWQPTTNPQFDKIETEIPIGYAQLNSNLLTLTL